MARKDDAGAEREKVQIWILKADHDALRKLAEQESRTVAMQIQYFIRRGLAVASAERGDPA